MKFNEIIKQVEENEYSAFFYTPTYYKKSISYLLLKPTEKISVYKKEDINYAFKHIHKMINEKLYGYSLINYEAGFLFEKKLEKYLNDQEEKLIQFFFFENEQVNRIKSSQILFDDIDFDNYSISNFKLNRTKSQFFKDLARIKHYLKEGDTYQVNYTVKGKFNFNGSYSSFFQQLQFNQSAKYSSIINTDDKFIISLSPELFFQSNGTKIFSRPMKGTNRRGFNNQSDDNALQELKNSEKNLAENVMIVDLIRNDLGRICKYGSVNVPALYEIEKYESLFQMVSEVKGKLKKKIKLKEILQSLFPCGSVTGAPKIRTVEIINEIEKDKRDIYTGSIGLIKPKEIIMNVAIRTITLDKNSGKGLVGLGSGIVWDSDPKEEYEEVLLKSRFLTEPEKDFEIFETMKLENKKINFLEEHLSRMKNAADYFLFKFSQKKILRQIEQSISSIDSVGIRKIKVSMNKYGNIKIEISDYPEIEKSISVIVSPSRINSKNIFQNFKTTNRKLYESEYELYKSQGFFEVLYFNENDELVEGSRTNIFIIKDGQLYTPASSSGALPGVYRKYFINKNNFVSEVSLKMQDISEADSILLTNSLMGEVKISRIFLNDQEFIVLNDSN